MGYMLEGELLEVCTCKILCPCWVGEDPDFGTCEGTLAWRIDEGNIDGVDVSGLSICILAHIPGNILQGNWRAVVYVDERASEEQEKALLKVYSGEAGGPVADFAQLVGEIVGVERVPFVAEVTDGKGMLKVGNDIIAKMEPYSGATGATTALSDTAFSTIPGSPAIVGKSPMYKAHKPSLGIDVDLEGHNAVQGRFRFEMA